VGEAKKKRSGTNATPSEPGETPRAEAAPPPRASTSSSPIRIAAVALVIVAFSFGTMWLRTRGQTSHRDAGPPPSDAHTKASSSRPEALRVHVLATHPHDATAFTQGLQWYDGALYEGTGLEGRSQLRRIQIPDWAVEQHVDLPGDVFGEGIAVVGDRIFEITWRNHVAYVWNRADFAPVRQLAYEGEGWGLCYDGTNLVMSDGSDELFFRDPTTFEVVRSVHVRRAGHEVDQLNELECVDGLVYANIWQTDRIARIDPASGRVTGWIDASGLLTDDERYDADVLNGITWLPDAHRFLITGKLWPRSFEVEFVADERASR
jgi:glutaminyl-peptide cyclotransferase